MWRWHAVEEIEHKAVAYDTYRHATRDWSRWKRWRVKSLVMARSSPQLRAQPHPRRTLILLDAGRTDRLARARRL
jgi:predicted metal-dependent hydrolase